MTPRSAPPRPSASLILSGAAALLAAAALPLPWVLNELTSSSVVDLVDRHPGYTTLMITVVITTIGVAALTALGVAGRWLAVAGIVVAATAIAAWAAIPLPMIEWLGADAYGNTVGGLEASTRGPGTWLMLIAGLAAGAAQAARPTALARRTSSSARLTANAPAVNAAEVRKAAWTPGRN